MGRTVQVINNRIHEELTFNDLSSSFEVRRELLNDHHRENNGWKD